MTKITLNKVRDYFYGRCNASEEVELQRWFAENSDTEQADSLLQELFDEVRIEDSVLAQEAFRRFCDKIGQSLPAAPASLTAIPQPRRGIKTLISWTQRAAAILIIPLMIAITVLYTSQNRQPSEWSEIVVPSGERSYLQLSDGTQLWLNAGTRVTYPNQFNGPQRKIFIDGEVFAEVSHDKKHPFIISAGEVEVEVLGTKFNMRAYNADPSVEVALVDGSVRFDVNSSICKEQILMARSEIVQYDRLTGQVERRSFQSDNYKSRAHGGGFYFFNEPMASIAAQLSRCFNHKIIITDPDLEQMQFYAFFTDNESLKRILDTFNTDGSLVIREQNGIIYLSLSR